MIFVTEVEVRFDRLVDRTLVVTALRYRSKVEAAAILCRADIGLKFIRGQSVECMKRKINYENVGNTGKF